MMFHDKHISVISLMKIFLSETEVNSGDMSFKII